MLVTDAVRGMIKREVHAAVVRNPIPDPDEVLAVRCAYCDRRCPRPRRVIERDNLKQGFFACRNSCKRAQLAKRERIFVPMRGA